MRFRLSHGATLLLAVAALNVDPAFAQDRRPVGTICVENAGAFVIGTKFDFRSEEHLPVRRSVDVGTYPVLQTRCTEFRDGESVVDIEVTVLAGLNKKCRVLTDFYIGQTFTAKMHGTTFDNRLACPY